MSKREASPGEEARTVVRGAARASLSTLLGAPETAGESPGGGAWPYVSLVLPCVDHDASPLLLLSDLADHTKNLKADPRAALLFDGSAGWTDPLAGPRVSLLGELRPLDDPRLDDRLRARFVARHPGAAVYAGFADFRLYRMAVARAHLVAGFGRIHWLEAADILFQTAGAGALADAEADILAHMNADHVEALCLMAHNILGLEGDDWSMTGIDPEGADLRCGGRRTRIAFEAPVRDPEAARRELVRLTRAARAGGGPASAAG